MAYNLIGGTLEPSTENSPTNNAPAINNPVSGSAIPNNAGIPQTERLFTVRPRSTGRKDRGTRSKIRILPLDKQEFINSSNIQKGIDIPLNDLFSTDETGGWNEFFLTDVQCSMNEKVQVMELFGDNHVAYYFGKSPTTFQLSGLIFDSIDNDWFSRFLTIYENFLRGSKMAKNYALLEIMLPNMKIIGSVTMLNYAQNSSRDTDINFTMSVLAKSVELIPLSIPEITAASLLNTVDWPAAVGNLPRTALNSLKTYSSLLAYIQQPLTPSMDIFGMAAGLARIANPLASGLGLNANTVNQLTQAIQTVGGPITAAAGQSMGILNAAGNDMAGFINQATPGLVNAANEALPSVINAGNQILSQLPTGSQLGFPDISLPNMEIPNINIPNPSSELSNIQFPDFSGYTQQLGDIGNSVMGSVSGALSGLGGPGGFLGSMGGNLGGVLGGNNQVLGGISSTLTGFKSGLFSPVFGFLSSITKIVASVTGNLSKVLMAFTSPVNSVLRDITQISREVIGITNFITTGVNNLVGIPKQTLNNITTMINTLRRAAGAISRLPINISDAFGALFKGGSITKGAVVLKSSHGRRINPAYLLNSGRRWTPSSSMTLPSTIRRFT